MTVTFSIPDMTCGHCKAAVERAIAAVDPAAKVDVDLATHTARLETSADSARLIAALAEAGYAATPRR
jgi:copper chaperone